MRPGDSCWCKLFMWTVITLLLKSIDLESYRWITRRQFPCLSRSFSWSTQTLLLGIHGQQLQAGFSSVFDKVELLWIWPFKKTNKLPSVNGKGVNKSYSHALRTLLIKITDSVYRSTHVTALLMAWHFRCFYVTFSKPKGRQQSGICIASCCTTLGWTVQ